MLHTDRVAFQARVQAHSVNLLTGPRAQLVFRIKPQPCVQHKQQLPRSKAKSVQLHRCSGSIACSASVTTQSVTEAVRQATVDKPLLHHGLHSAASSLAWFGVVWVITRYISQKAKESESPELCCHGCTHAKMHSQVLNSSCCRRQHRPSFQKHPLLCRGLNAPYMCMLAMLYLSEQICQSLCLRHWQQWSTH